jgi:hypothetical protein
MTDATLQSGCWRYCSQLDALGVKPYLPVIPSPIFPYVVIQWPTGDCVRLSSLSDRHFSKLPRHLMWQHFLLSERNISHEDKE